MEEYLKEFYEEWDGSTWKVKNDKWSRKAEDLFNRILLSKQYLPNQYVV